MKFALKYLILIVLILLLINSVSAVKVTRYVGNLAEVKNGEITFKVNDLRGSTRVVVNASNGEVIAKSHTLPFGQSIKNQDVKYDFTGKERDATEMHYFNARYYDSELGKFLSVDAVEDNHAYAYVSNNPYKYVDPTGLDDERTQLLLLADTKTYNDLLTGFNSKIKKNQERSSDFRKSLNVHFFNPNFKRYSELSTNIGESFKISESNHIRNALFWGSESSQRVYFDEIASTIYDTNGLRAKPGLEPDFITSHVFILNHGNVDDSGISRLGVTSPSGETTRMLLKESTDLLFNLVSDSLGDKMNEMKYLWLAVCHGQDIVESLSKRLYDEGYSGVKVYGSDRSSTALLFNHMWLWNEQDLNRIYTPNLELILNSRTYVDGIEQ
jgi:RHS repeat-associated protein